MKKLLFLCFSALVMTSCQSKMTFEPQHYQAQDKAKCLPEEGCAKFSLDIMAATGKNVASDSINNSVFKMIRRAMYVGEKPQEAKNYLQLANSFVQTHEQIKKEFQERFKETPPSWEATGKSHVQWQSDKIVNVVFEYYAFTGGAHGYGAKLSEIFDAQTGKTIPNRQLFTDSLSVLNMVEEQFRKQHKIAPKTSLTEAGYFLPDDQFVFPKNIYYNAKGIVFHYNPYEIAAYVVGDIEVVLPYAKMDQYLRFK
jgi:hypothetical protein